MADRAKGEENSAGSEEGEENGAGEIEVLIEKIEQNKLEERERRLIVALLRTFLYVVSQLQENSHRFTH